MSGIEDWAVSPHPRTVVFSEPVILSLPDELSGLLERLLVKFFPWCYVELVVFYWWNAISGLMQLSLFLIEESGDIFPSL